MNQSIPTISTIEVDNRKLVRLRMMARRLQLGALEDKRLKLLLSEDERIVDLLNAVDEILK